MRPTKGTERALREIIQYRNHLDKRADAELVKALDRVVAVLQTHLHHAFVDVRDFFESTLLADELSAQEKASIAHEIAMRWEQIDNSSTKVSANSLLQTTLRSSPRHGDLHTSGRSHSMRYLKVANDPDVGESSFRRFRLPTCGDQALLPNAFNEAETSTVSLLDPGYPKSDGNSLIHVSPTKNRRNYNNALSSRRRSAASSSCLEPSSTDSVYPQPKRNDKNNNFSPFDSENRLCSVLREKRLLVHLSRASTGFGFSIAGGTDQKPVSSSVDQGFIYVARITPGGVADTDGRLMVNDRILAVNGQKLLGVMHFDAVEIFEKSGSHLELLIERSTERLINQRPSGLARTSDGSSRTSSGSHRTSVIDDSDAVIPAPKQRLMNQLSSSGEFPAPGHASSSGDVPRPRLARSHCMALAAITNETCGISQTTPIAHDSASSLLASTGLTVTTTGLESSVLASVSPLSSLFTLATSSKVHPSESRTPRTPRSQTRQTNSTFRINSKSIGESRDDDVWLLDTDNLDCRNTSTQIRNKSNINNHDGIRKYGNIETQFPAESSVPPKCDAESPSPRRRQFVNANDRLGQSGLRVNSRTHSCDGLRQSSQTVASSMSGTAARPLPTPLPGPMIVEVPLVRGTRTGFGFSIAGGLDSQYVAGDSGIFITQIASGGVADTSGRISIGDRLVRVNSVSLDGVTHEQAVAALQSAGDFALLVIVKVASSAIFFNNSGDGEFHTAQMTPKLMVMRPIRAQGSEFQANCKKKTRNSYIRNHPKSESPKRRRGPPEQNPSTYQLIRRSQQGLTSKKVNTITVHEQIPDLDTREATRRHQKSPKNGTHTIISLPTEMTRTKPPSRSEAVKPFKTTRKHHHTEQTSFADIFGEADYAAANAVDESILKRWPDSRLVTLYKNENSMRRRGREINIGSGSLGFNIIGGDGADGVFVSHIQSNSPADKSRSIFIGDRLLVVNGEDISSCSHEEVAILLKTSPKRVDMVLSFSPEEYKHLEEQFTRQTTTGTSDHPSASNISLEKIAGVGSEGLLNLHSIEAAGLFVRVLADFNPNEQMDQTFPKSAIAIRSGDILQLVNVSDREWWQARRVYSSSRKLMGPVGLVPSRHHLEHYERLRLHHLQMTTSGESSNASCSPSVDGNSCGNRRYRSTTMTSSPSSAAEGCVTEKVNEVIEGQGNSAPMSPSLDKKAVVETQNGSKCTTAARRSEDERSTEDHKSGSSSRKSSRNNRERGVAGGRPLSYIPVVPHKAAHTRPVVLLGDLKDSLADDLLSDFPEKFGTCVPFTTRPRRRGEVEGRDYHFVKSRPKMESEIAMNRYIEAGEYNQNLYGTHIQSVFKVAASGLHCLLDVGGPALERLTTAGLSPIAVLVHGPLELEASQPVRVLNAPRDDHESTSCNSLSKEERRRRSADQIRLAKIREKTMSFLKNFSAYLTAIVVVNDYETAYDRVKEVIEENKGPRIWLASNEFLP